MHSSLADLRERALKAVGRTRSVGPHFYANLLEISYPQRDASDFVLGMADDPAGHNAPVAVGAMATLADLALGAAVRREVGPSRRLATVTLDLSFTGTVARGEVQARPQITWVEPGAQRQAHARCDVHDRGGNLLATGSAWFMAVPVPAGTTMPALPWEVDQATAQPVASDQLDAVEREAVEVTLVAGKLAAENGTSVIDELLRPRWGESVGQLVQGTLDLGPAITNRVGHAQGGALFGVAAAAALRAAGDDMQLATAKMQYMRPGAGDRLVTSATLLRRGTVVAFVHSQIDAAGGLVASGSFVLLRSL
jgi:acyl-coenzyme A thioesterase PaaI-like protein